MKPPLPWERARIEKENMNGILNVQDNIPSGTCLQHTEVFDYFDLIPC
jgi:hypothetical protein